MSLLVIGELGEVFKLDGPNDLKKCVELYNKRLSLDCNDIYLLDKNGKSIHFNSMHEINYDSKFFIFNKTFCREQLIKIFEENVDKISTGYISQSNSNYLPINIVILNIDSLFNSAFTQNFVKIEEKCQISTNELKSIAENFEDNLCSVKALFKSLKIQTRICEKIRDNYNYQYSSLECIYKNISNLYEQCFTKFREMETECNKMNDKNENILTSFKDSIERLKSIELHPKMQTPKEKYLIDIYFDESKMDVWKDRCLKSSEMLNSKVKSKGDVIVSEKNKIRNEKNTLILQLKNDWNQIIIEYENFISEKEVVSLSILTHLCDDIKLFQKNTALISEFRDEESIDEVVGYFINIRSVLVFQKDQIQSFHLHLNSIEEFAKKMKNLLIKASSKINSVFMSYHLIKKSLIETMEKLDKYGTELTSLDKDFSYLANPAFFPQAYNASILEVKRRFIFNRKINKSFDRIKQYVHKENATRKQFIHDYGKYLAHDYIPELKFTDLKLTIELLNNNELVNIPNLLEEHEEISISNSHALEEDINISQHISTRKNSEEKTKHTNYETESLSVKVHELDIMNSVKENEIKKLYAKLEQKDRKITFLQTEIEKLSFSLDSISDNFNKQISFKEQKLREKLDENDNLIKLLNSNRDYRLDSCLMCRDSALNSIDYQSWGNFVKEYHEKILQKNQSLTKIENRYTELVNQTNFIKKTFFNHLNSIIESKNTDLLNVKSEYERKLTNMEDLLSIERSKVEKQINLISSGHNHLEEEIKNKSQTISLLENKLKEASKSSNNYETEIKRLKEQIKKITERENNLIVDLKAKDTRIDNLSGDYFNLEKQVDGQKKNINSLSEEIIAKSKENSTLKHDLEIQTKIIEDLEKSLDNYKINHIDTLQEVHKANQSNIEKLNTKIDEVTATANNKLEEYKSKCKELETELAARREEIGRLNEEVSSEVNTQRYETDRVTQQNEALKRRVEEMQTSLLEKDKKLLEYGELTKFFSTNDNYLSYNKTNDITNNYLTHSLTMGITKYIEEEYINIKKLDKGQRAIFVPHSPGVYVCINLSDQENFEMNRYYKCNAILNLETFDSEMKELLYENSLIVVGKIHRLKEITVTADDNPLQLPEEKDYILIEVEKADYILGFQGEEMLFRNYLF